jgi:outer membrane protein assembly factor BamB
MPETTQFGTGDDQENGSRTLKPNTLLMGRYRILGVLGGGGMGTVYQARDMNFPDVKRLVAVKEMLTPDNSQRASTLSTFRRESNLLASLNHPSIPKIYEFFDTNDRAYVVMEYINGSDLEIILNKTRQLPIDKVIDWAIEMCDVLEYLHSHSPSPIVFRDIKPANIMIDSFGKVRLIDFGIAKVFVDNKKHTMIGTEGYSAPEQYRGDVTPLSDVYGLGATLHHILTRRDPRLEPPFSFNERPIAQLNPNVPQPLISIIDRALAISPADRFQSCAEMKKALETVRMHLANPQGITAESVKSGAGPAAADHARAPAADAQTSAFEDAKIGDVQPRWKFQVEDEIRAGPFVYRDMVFVGSYDTNIWGLDATSGTLLWKYPTGAGIATTPVVDPGSKLVMVGSEDKTFYALDVKTGRMMWTFTTRDKIRSTARAEHDHVFFGSDDGKVYALVAMNGRHLWDFDFGSPVRTRPFVTNELVIAASESGDIMALELSGKRKWAYRVKRGIHSSPMVDMEENLCFIGGYDGFLHALDASSGFTVWRARTNGPIIATPAIDGKLVYVGSADGILYAIQIDNGKERWKYDTGRPIVGSPVVVNDAVIFGGTDQVVYCVNTRNGKLMWQFRTEGEITGAPAVSDRLVLVGSMDKTLYALPLAIM